MLKRKEVPSAEYFSLLNNELKRHKSYRPDMTVSSIDSYGNLKLKTCDKVQSKEDLEVFDEVMEKINTHYKLKIS